LLFISKDIHIAKVLVYGSSVAKSKVRPEDFLSWNNIEPSNLHDHVEDDDQYLRVHEVEEGD